MVIKEFKEPKTKYDFYRIAIDGQMRQAAANQGN